MGFYSHYKGRSVGRVLGALEAYCGLTHWVERCQIGDGRVTFAGKIVATYEWVNDDTPRFTFFGDFAHYQEDAEMHEPFLDDEVQFRQRPEYIVQEVQKGLSFDEALCLRWIRDEVKDFQFLNISVQDKIKQSIREANWNEIPEEWVERHWKHLAMQAIRKI